MNLRSLRLALLLLIRRPELWLVALFVAFRLTVESPLSSSYRLAEPMQAVMTETFGLDEK